MSKKVFVVILVLSVVVTYGMAIVDFVFNITTGRIGLPFGFSSFNLLGSSTDYTMFIIDIAFWFFVILGMWKILQKVAGKK